jgi:hypothetical protein
MHTEAGRGTPKLIARRRADLLSGVLIFVVTLSIFLASKVHQIADSNYSMLLSQSLLDQRSFMLDSYAIPRYEPVWFGDHFINGPLYHLEVVDGHLYYHFPPGSSILSVPFVGVMNMFGVSAANPDGTYNLEGEGRTEVKLAAILMAGLASLFFFTARLMLPLSWSVAVALGGALGTQVYSTASRALWSDTWGILLLGVVILLLLAHETGRRRFNAVVLATLLAWMYFVRPTFAVHILAISIYMLMFLRKQFISYAVTGAVWLAGFVLYSWYHFGTLVPSYYRAGRLQFYVFWEALAGNLISPGRGTLVYVPALFFVAYLLARYWRYIPLPRLLLLALSIVAGHLFIISGFGHWWAGHSFGPRFTTGLVPWFVLLTILGLKARQTCRESHAVRSGSRAVRRVELVLGGALLLLSVLINTLGATEHATWLWNQKPLGVDEHPERLWDWRQPQFLAGLLPVPPPRVFPSGEGRVEFGSPEAERYMWYGWGKREEGLRWSDGKEAALVFASDQQEDITLKIRLGALVVTGRHEQRVSISLNGQPLQTLLLREDGAREYALLLPKEVLRGRNVLTFGLPDAVSPKSLGQSDDTRILAIAIYWMEFQPVAAASVEDHDRRGDLNAEDAKSVRKGRKDRVLSAFFASSAFASSAFKSPL